MIGTLLISEAAIKASSPLDSNVSGEILLPCIKYTQDSIIEPIIGSKLMIKLFKLIDSGEINDPINIDYNILLNEYIFNTVLWSVQAELCIPLSLKTRQTGVIYTNDEHIQNTQLSELKYLAQYYNNRADYYAGRLKSFIQYNGYLFKELVENTKADIQPNSTPTYTTTLYLDNKKCK